MSDSLPADWRSIDENPPPAPARRTAVPRPPAGPAAPAPQPAAASNRLPIPWRMIAWGASVTVHLITLMVISFLSAFLIEPEEVERDNFFAVSLRPRSDLPETLLPTGPTAQEGPAKIPE